MTKTTFAITSYRRGANLFQKDSVVQVIGLQTCIVLHIDFMFVLTKKYDRKLPEEC